MNKPLEPGQLAELQREFPVEEAPVKLTRAQKLNHLAGLIEEYRGPYLRLGHNIERRSDPGLAVIPVSDVGALEIASVDETFLKDGLKAAVPNQFSVKDVRDYLELTTGELHEFSCDCGGPISPGSQASRVRGLADRGAPQPNFLSRAVTAIIGT